jgi:hypoxia up-regulated 1
MIEESVAVISIDLGSEFMKIAIVKPGIPMEIVLNKETRRKTPLAVSLRGDEREFGEMALAQAIKRPKTAYMFITDILGKSLDNPAVKAYQERFPYYDMKEDEITKTVYFQHDEQTRYTPEELLAMILENARELAADFGEQKIDSAVISVPPYFNQAERKAVLRAAELANLKVLQLINTNIAAGLNYGVFRRKDFNSSGTSLMFFDMGSTGTTATIASYHLIKTKDEPESYPQLVIRGVGFDRSLGSNAFTMRLAKHLANEFKKKTGKDVYRNPKSLLKIYKEAERVKNVLSANSDHFAQIESLMDDVDFKLKVTRAEFEEMCKDLFARIQKTIDDAYSSSEMSADEVTQLILMGAGTRTPKVQEELLRITKRKELGKNLNTDEAAALGAVYQAAYASKGYKVKKFGIKDLNIYPIVVDFERYSTEVEHNIEKNNRIRRVLFDRSNQYPQKKVLTFGKHLEDFSFFVNYGDLEFLDEKTANIIGKTNLSEVNILGVKEMYAAHLDEETKGIKVHFRMDESGILQLDKVDATFVKNLTSDSDEVSKEESTLSKIGNTISNFFGKKNEETTTVVSEEETGKEFDAETGETKDKPETETKEEQDKSPKKEEKKEETAKTTVPPVETNKTTSSLNNTAPLAPITQRIDVKYILTDYDFIDPGQKVIDDSKEKLEKIKIKEKEKRRREKAINLLETNIFSLKDKLSDNEFIKCATSKEIETITEKVNELEMWLSDADDTVETKTFNEKLAQLKSATKEVRYRIDEKKQRPKVLEEMRDVLNKSSHFLKSIHNLTGDDLPITLTERDNLDKLINTTKVSFFNFCHKRVNNCYNFFYFYLKKRNGVQK